MIGALAACQPPPTDEPDAAHTEQPAGKTEAEQQQASASELALAEEFSALAQGFSGTVGIAVRDLQSSRTIGFNSSEMLPQQSVTKLWVALTALDLVDQGKLELAERAVIGRDDLTLFHQPLRNVVSRQGRWVGDYGELMEMALTGSDNTANDALLRRAGGPQAVEAFLARKRIAGVRFGSDERTKQSRIAGLEWDQSYSVKNRFYEARDAVPDAQRKAAFEGYLADPEDGATASAMALALARLAEGDLLSPSSTIIALNIL